MNYHNILSVDMKNGVGLRTVLFVSGCSHKCPGCHNPQTHDKNSGVEFDTSAMNELMNYLDKDYISGITFSGGDPLYLSNRSEIAFIINTIRIKYGNSKDIWIYTGYKFEELLRLSDHDLNIKFILNNSDILVDGRFIKELKNSDLEWRGSSNQRVIILPDSLKSNKIITLNE